jgi:hypothetical protein
MQPVLHGAADTVGLLRALNLAAPNVDAQNMAGFYGLQGNAAPFLFNETTFDRQRGNTAFVLAASLLRTATLTLGALTNFNARGIKVTIDVTAASGTGGVTAAIQVNDPASGKWITLLSSVNILAVSTVTLTLYPGIAAVANVSANDVLARTYRVVVTHGDASNYTYSLGANLIV